MLKFIIDKIRDNQGPFKSARLVVGDIMEEVVDLAGHYINKIRGRQEPISAPPPVADAAPPKPPRPKTSAQKSPKSTKTKKTASSTKRTKSAEKKPVARTIEVSSELASALDNPANQRKQEFKVLAILWDAKHRDQSGLSAKALSDHGTKLGLEIRHENIRKVIKMRLSSYVEILQEVNNRASIYHYRLNEAGSQYFSDTYLH